LPSEWEEEESFRGPGLLNAAYPIEKNGKVIGYLATSFSGDQVDKILDVSARNHKGKLLVAELNPDNAERDGLLLYDDVRGIRFKAEDGAPYLLREQNGAILWNAAKQKPFGEIVDDKNRARIYYTEYLPYPNQLVSWIVATRIDMEAISAPFNRIRVAILVLVGVSLLMSILIAHLGAKTVARPIVEMARSLKRYANGDHSVRVNAVGADEIQQLETSFNYMAETLDHAREERDRAQNMMLQGAKLASIGEMAAGIGHEINNPLNNILSLSKLIKRSLPEDNEKLSQDIDSLREETLRASSIVKGILNFARQVPPSYSHFAAADWIQETLDLVQQAAYKKHIHFNFEADHDLWINGDRNQLQQVIVNLLLNAIYASPDNGEIWIRIHRQDDETCIQIQDQGAGIEQEKLERIFDPFFTTKPEGEGSGLGLSISLGIIERHGGSLQLENNEDRGVTATIRLPLREEEVSA
jgi:two-component system NtrC family sensor kinase